MCENHNLPIDLVCEDCDEFICSTCVKTDHNGHDWVTLGVAASRRRKGLTEFLRNIKKGKLPQIDKKITKMKAENDRTYESQRKNLKKHFDEIIKKLTDIRDRKDVALKSNLSEKNEQFTNGKSRIDKKKKQIIEIMKHMEDNHRTMSDKNLIENQRDLNHLLTDLEIDIGESNFSLRYKEKVINDDILESLFCGLLDLDNISAIETNLFQYVTCSEDVILYVETLNENECYVYDMESDNVDLVNKQGEKKQTFNIGRNVKDMCVTNKGIYFTKIGDKLIRCLSPSGSISTFFSADAVDLEPTGISSSVDDGFLVSLKDFETDDFELESGSRRLVKYLTMTGDIIHEYEYQEDGQTRLFTYPGRLCQNNNTDICVMNITSDNTGEIVIITVSSLLRSVYRGQNLKEDFFPADLVCDSICNILVSDAYNSLIHLLSPEGEFLKYLLTEQEVTRPMAISLYKSTLWVGTAEGIVKIFKHRSFS
ncbi:uncharacterized protein LOC134257926 [Saccostrea cucullata]|uniref:uncharacterized protein LOC134257926 n=1 Tax=Saccostrea cuccullata TaxID=36930 RepID=UPI002ED0339D